MPLKIEIESVDRQFSKELSVKTCSQKVTGNYRIVNWTEHRNKFPHLTQCSFAKPANNRLVDLLLLALITLNSTILTLISEGKVVDPSPALGHLGGVALVRLTKTKLRERDLTSFVPRLQKNLYGATEENLVVMSITASRGSGKSRSLAQNVLTYSYSPRKND